MTHETDNIATPLTAAREDGFGGVHDPSFFHDGCGVACVARLDGKPIHETIDRALVALDRLEHRGASGADESTGDGAGIMVGLPHDFFRSRAAEIGIAAGRAARPRAARRRDVLPPPRPAGGTERSSGGSSELVAEAGPAADRLARRSRSTRPPAASSRARRRPRIRQLLIGAGPEVADEDEFERSLFVIRRRAELELAPTCLVPEHVLPRRIVYKGMLTAPQLPQFYPDLRDLSLRSTFAIVHSRFSTNTAPSWELAQPLRMIAHNGEINTVRGNVNWMRAREAVLSLRRASATTSSDCLPLIDEGASDSAAFDRALELMVLGGRSLPHAMMMMIPAAWEDRDDVPAELEGFYRYHSRLLEPWDGPAAIAFCDGRTARRDARPQRPAPRPLDDHRATAGSASARSRASSRVEPEQGRADGPPPAGAALPRRPRARAASAPTARPSWRSPAPRPTASGTRRASSASASCPSPRRTIQPSRAARCKRQLAFGYTQEDLRVLLAPLLRDGREPTGSMGNDLALAVLLRPRARRSSPTSSSASRRSRTRRSTRSASTS